MAVREIITIDEDLCNGCGECITACAEGALQLVNGKAKLVKEQYCDGFGDCIGDCPTGALVIKEVESEEFDIVATKEYLLETQGQEAADRMLQVNIEHDKKMALAAKAETPDCGCSGHGDKPADISVKPPAGGGCPGSRMRMVAKEASAPAVSTLGGGPVQAIRSDLEQWPVQLHLVQPGMPFFKNKELVVLSTCSPVASADVHWKFIRGRSVVVACPKLDKTEPYVAKLGGILAETTIPKVIIVRMEVPCCGGLTKIVSDAHALSGRIDLIVEEVTVGAGGDILSTRTM
jgi:ferredoxin